MVLVNRVGFSVIIRSYRVKRENYRKLKKKSYKITIVLLYNIITDMEEKHFEEWINLKEKLISTSLKRHSMNYTSKNVPPTFQKGGLRVTSNIISLYQTLSVLSSFSERTGKLRT